MKMSDDDLLNQIEHLERQALGYYTSQVAGEQAKAMNYYLGKPFGTEEEGRSAVVSSDVWDVVEGLTPLILKPFVSSDEVVRFNPQSEDDEDASEQETDYINWVVTAKNAAFTELVAWVKTGLLQKNGVVKYWWEKSSRTSVERYFGIDDDTFTLLQQDSAVQVIEHTPGAGPDGTAHDVTLRVSEEIGTARYRAIPPEEFLIDRSADCPDPQQARFVQHRRKVTLHELRAMGYDAPDDLADGGEDDLTSSSQYMARHSNDGSMGWQDEGLDRGSREVTLRETFMLIDFDGDGQAELRKVCAVGRTVFANEETEEIPFCAWTPYPQPHKFYGRCPADETLEIQLIKSTLWRQSLDNIYTINNNRVYANEDVVLDDLIDNQIAGVVRIKGGGPVGNAVQSAAITPIGGVVQPMIEYLDQAKENRTGFTRYNQGSDAGSLNKTATGIRIITAAANSRVEIVARAFAEQGLAPLMRGIHGLCRRHATKAETTRLRGKWVQIDPRAWKSRIDLTVSVGLGSQDQEMRLQGIQMILNEQKQMVQLGLVQPEQMLAAERKLAEAVGFKNPEQFFGQKDEQQQQPQVPPEMQQAMQQASEQLEQLQQENEQLKSGVHKAQIDAQSRETIASMDVQAKDGQAQRQAEIDLQKAAQDADAKERERELAQWKAGFERETALMLEQVKAEARERELALTLAAQHMHQPAQEGGEEPKPGLAEMAASIQMLAATMAMPKRLIRDSQGRPAGVEPAI